MTPLFEHQKAGVDFILQRGGSGALLWEMGTGKTRGAIELYARLRVGNPALKLLVVCPLSLIEAAWGADIKKFSSFTYRNGHKDGLDNIKEDILVVNYEQLRNKWQEINSWILMIPVMAVLDESTKIKAHDSQITKILLRLAPRFKHRVVMSGMPTPNSELEWWGQINFVDPYVLGSSFHQFKNTYFHLERNGQIMHVPQGGFVTREMMSKLYKQGAEYKITPANRSRMMARISPYCSVAKKANCLDLPDQVDEIREISMTQVQTRAYRDMKNHLIAELGDLFGEQEYISPIVAQNALTKLMKLREITSGFAINDRNQEVDLGPSPKLTELKNLVEESQGQLVIWGNYKWEIRKIEELLSRIAPVSTLYSDTKDRDHSIEAFQRGDTRFFVAHPASAAHGLTLVNASTEIFFSLSYSSEQYEQARARIHRAGQTQKCTYIHLLASGTIDEEIYKVIQGKTDAQQILLIMIPRRVAA